MENNVCRFLPNNENMESINILNFVYEREHQSFHALRLETVYKIHIVLKGSGRLHIIGNSYPLKFGDVFFTFPSEHYAIESEEDFEYMYISYIGLRTNRLMDKLGITKKNFLFENMQQLIPIWESSIFDDKSIMNLRCEGILLYTFSALGNDLMQSRKEAENEDIILSVKKYIDDNFSETDLSLEKISGIYSYNPKYISSRFKDKFNIGISNYITMLRIQKACTLMEQGFTSVKDISCQCGFGEQFYFSRVFKTKMGLSPTEHIKKLRKNNY